MERISGELAKIALRLDGVCTGEDGIGWGKLQNMYAEHGPAVDIMRLIKDALDPLGILKPGKGLPTRDMHHIERLS